MRFLRHYSLMSGEVKMLPIVNLVLLLLFFFVLTSGYVARQGPENRSAVLPGQENRQEVVITVSKDGLIGYNNSGIGLPDLGVLLREKVAQNSNVVLVIKARENVRHGDIMRIMEEAQQAGVVRVEMGKLP